MFVDLFLLVCFPPKEVPLVFIVKLVWWCWILLPTWLQGNWSYPLRCPKSSANVEQVLCEDCFICRCILNVLARRDKFHIILFHHLDSSLPAGFLKKSLFKERSHPQHSWSLRCCVGKQCHPQVSVKKSFRRLDLGIKFTLILLILFFLYKCLKDLWEKSSSDEV